jgi:hypothetical protein
MTNGRDRKAATCLPTTFAAIDVLYLLLGVRPGKAALQNSLMKSTFCR